MQDNIDLFSYLLGKSSSGGGGDITLKTLNVYANDSITAPSGEAYNKVIVQVPTPTLEDVTITQNGTTEAIEGKAFKKVTVEVPTYPEPTGSINITENGTYDVTEVASAEVNVQSSGDPYAKVKEIYNWDFKRENLDFSYTFYRTNIKYDDLIAIGFKLPESSTYQCLGLFQHSTIDRLPKLDWRTSSGKTHVFYGCKDLETIDYYNTNVGTNMFYNCTALKNVTFAKECISNNILLSESSLLTDETLVSLANALYSTSPKTVSLHDTPKSRLSTIMGNVTDGSFVKDDNGTVDLETFITSSDYKGWTLA